MAYNGPRIGSSLEHLRPTRMAKPSVLISGKFCLCDVRVSAIIIFIFLLTGFHCKNNHYITKPKQNLVFQKGRKIFYQVEKKATYTAALARVLARVAAVCVAFSGRGNVIYFLSITFNCFQFIIFISLFNNTSI